MKVIDNNAEADNLGMLSFHESIKWSEGAISKFKNKFETTLNMQKCMKPQKNINNINEEITTQEFS